MQKCNQCGYENPANTNYCGSCGAGLTGATGQLNPDTVLEGRYIILKTIGRGGMGAVYLALDTRLNHIPVAVKEMSSQASGGDLSAAVAAFQKEASLLTNLHHPALPTIRDFFPRESRWYLVMDYIEGTTLQDIALKRGPVPEAEVLDWARQLCDILDYLHNQNPPVIFRDLKPSNIMLTPEGEIKLIDFGIARHFRPGSTADTAAFISSGFAPPEQYGTNQTDPRSDIYALGATLHYLLTGINPAPNPFSFELPGKHVKLSPRMETAVMKALELKTENRPRNAQEMLNLLPKGAVRPAARPVPAASKNQEAKANLEAISPPGAITPTSSTNRLTGTIPDAALDSLPDTAPIQVSAGRDRADPAFQPGPGDKTVADLAGAQTTPLPSPANDSATSGTSARRKSRLKAAAAIILLLLLIPGGWFATDQIKHSKANIGLPEGKFVSSNENEDNSLDPMINNEASGDKTGSDAGSGSSEANPGNQEEPRSADVPVATSGVTIQKVDYYAGNQHIRGIEVYIEPSLLPPALKEKARYAKCDMSPVERHQTLQQLQQFVDNNWGSDIKPIGSGYKQSLTSNSLSFDEPYGQVVILDENYQIVGYYQSKAQ